MALPVKRDFYFAIRDGGANNEFLRGDGIWFAIPVDGDHDVPSLRTLGPGVNQAVANDDSRLADGRTPVAHHTTHEPGGSDEVTGLSVHAHKHLVGGDDPISIPSQSSSGQVPIVPGIATNNPVVLVAGEYSANPPLGVRWIPVSDLAPWLNI